MSYNNQQVEIIIRATGAKTVSYDILGVTLTMPNYTSLFINYAAGQAIEMLRFEVERGIIAKARAEALSAKAIT